MTKSGYSKAVQLSAKTEIEKATLVAFYLFKIRGQDVFPMSVLIIAMIEFGLNIPNQSRLKAKVIKSANFAKAGVDLFRLSLKCKEYMEVAYPKVTSETEEIVAEETILPYELVRGTRGYVENVAKQINACYQHNVFDGCAMLMRRLLEMLIILIYKHNARENEVKDPKGGFYVLSYLINYSISNKVLGLSRDSEEMLDEFRQLGNYSAHGLEYTCKKSELKRVRIQFRVCIEEMLYKAGLKR